MFANIRYVPLRPPAAYNLSEALSVPPDVAERDGPCDEDSRRDLEIIMALTGRPWRLCLAPETPVLMLGTAGTGFSTWELPTP